MLYENIKMISDKGIPIYIWGSGEVGRLVDKRLKSIGVSVEDYVTDQANGGGIAAEALCKKGLEYAIVRGWLGAFYISDGEIKKRFKGCKYALTISDVYEPDFAEEMDAAYYEENHQRFEAAHSMLEDDLSRKVFDAFITAKIRHRSKELLPLVIPKQYFFEDHPWNYSDEDILVDCGAFDGDSIRDFIGLRGNKYREIIAFEPDEKNYEKLKKWIEISGIQNVLPIQSGVYKEKNVLTFNLSGDMESCFTEDGDMKIPVESIDGICSGKEVSIIKMDIEGSELDALKGGAETIKENEPILMISAYHKRDDLFILTDFIRNLSNNYRFFLRAHKPLPIDVVLYAVPKERMKL